MLEQLDQLGVREQFPMLAKEIIYFDSAATTLKPRCVIDTICKYYSEEYGTVHRALYRLSQEATRKYNETREGIARFINAASSDEVIFTKGTTEGINLVASCFSRGFLEKGDEIILSEMEHHSNIAPWQLLAKEKGVILRYIPIDERAVLDLDAYRKFLSPRTKLVSIAHIANSTGTLNPIGEIIDLAHEAGAKVLIDGAQAVAHLPIDVQELDVDFYAFSGHKMYGPTGIGVLYGKRELLSAMPPYQCGGDMIEKVTLEGTTFQEPPLRFEAGTPPIAQVLGLGSALRWIEEIGIERIQQWEGELLAYATKRVQEIEGLKIIGTAPRKGAIIAFTINGVHTLDLGTFLDLKGISLRTGHHCAQPLLHRFKIPSTARISFGVYNTFEEIDRFIAALKSTLETLKF